MGISKTIVESLSDRFFPSQSNNGSFVLINEDLDTWSDMNRALDCASTRTASICDQQTWVFSDNSYITQNRDEYWIGEDVSDFEEIERTT